MTPTSRAAGAGGPREPGGVKEGLGVKDGQEEGMSRTGEAREGQGETVGLAALASARSLSLASRGEAVVKLVGEERAESFV